MSGLPSQADNPYGRYNDIHMNTAKGGLPAYTNRDIHMATAKGTLHPDIRMETARGGDVTIKKEGLKEWERELLESSEVRRKSTVAQLCKLS